MSTDEIAWLSAKALGAHYACGDLSPVEVVGALSERIEHLDRSLNAITTASFEAALEAARFSEQRYLRGEALALDGIPIVVKDLIDTAGTRTTYGSKIFSTHVPDLDARVVSRLRAAGAVILGKAATHEFAWGITTDSEHFGPTRNPWDPDRVPGGSSGGSAVAVAAGLAPLALGTDTAGSVRIPAAFCGTVGFKPTFGAIDRTGVFRLAPTLDHVGVLARSVADARLLFDTVAEPTSGLHARHIDHRHSSVRDLVVAVCPDLDQIPVSRAVQTVVERAAAVLAHAGATVVEVRSPDVDPLFSTLATLVLAEGSHVHRHALLWPQRAADYGRDVRSRLEQADSVRLEDYLRAQAARLRAGTAMRGILAEADVLLSPVSAVPPVLIDEPTDADSADRQSFREMVITSTAPQSLAGLPACAVRGGFDDQGLPVGVQLTAPHRTDVALLEIAGWLYDATEPLQLRHPAPIRAGGRAKTSQRTYPPKL